MLYGYKSAIMLDYYFDLCMMVRRRAVMMKIIQRTINVIAILFLSFALYLSFDVVDDKLDAFLRVIGTGIAFVLVTNYIVFGKITLWHRTEKGE